MTYFIRVEHFAHFLLLRKQKESEFSIQKIRIAKKWIPLMAATCYFLSWRQVTAWMGVLVEGPAQPSPPLRHHDKGNKLNVAVICMYMTVKAVGVDRIN